ncbi:hypothetical protein EV175_007341, partial [Coemansia sp. RSA 1933]
MFDLLQLQATGTIEEFNGNFRHKCRLMGWDDKSSEGVGVYRFLMPQALRELLLRQDPDSIEMSMKLMQQH